MPPATIGTQEFRPMDKTTYQVTLRTAAGEVIYEYTLVPYDGYIPDTNGWRIFFHYVTAQPYQVVVQAIREDGTLAEMLQTSLPHEAFRSTHTDVEVSFALSIEPIGVEPRLISVKAFVHHH
jgi:hypothetical protein